MFTYDELINMPYKEKLAHQKELVAAYLLHVGAQKMPNA